MAHEVIIDHDRAIDLEQLDAEIRAMGLSGYKGVTHVSTPEIPRMIVVEVGELTSGQKAFLTRRVREHVSTPAEARPPGPLRTILAKPDSDITAEELRSAMLLAVRRLAERGLI
jgi:hypothetical protein